MTGNETVTLKISENKMNLVAAVVWISLEQEKPAMGERVLVSDGLSVFEAYLTISGQWARSGNPLTFMEPKYWAALPVGPEVTEKITRPLEGFI